MSTKFSIGGILCPHTQNFMPPHNFPLGLGFYVSSYLSRLIYQNLDICPAVVLFSLQECDTFFSEALQKWRELNCTLDFGML